MTARGAPWSLVALAFLSCSERPPPSKPASLPLEARAVVRQVQLAFRDDAAGRFEAVTPAGPVHFAGNTLRWSGVGAALETRLIARTHGPAWANLEPRGQVLDGALALQRGAVTERLRGVEQGLHQTFHFQAQPEGEGDLVVRLAVDGATWTGQSPLGHHFLTRSGAGLTYGPATWVDANGRRTPLEVHSDGFGALDLRVPSEVLEATAYPAVLDPLITTRSNLITPLQGFTNLSSIDPDVAFDGTNYLVTWYDNRSISGHLAQINGARVSAAGVLLDPGGFVIFRSLANGSEPAVTWDGTHFLVAAMDSSGSVRVNRVTPAGLLVDGPDGRQVDSTSGYVDVLDVAAGGGVGLVAWTNFTPGSGSVRARRFDATGALGAQLVLSSTGSDHVPAIAWNGSNFLVAWRQGYDGAYGNVVAVRVTPSGQVLDATPRILGTATAYANRVAVAAVGDQFHVTWTATTGVVVARLDANAAMLDASPLAIAPSGSSLQPTISSVATQSFVSWLTPDPANSGRSLLKQNRVSAAGAVLDGTGVTLLSNLPSSSSVKSTCGAVQCFTTWEMRINTFGVRVEGTSALSSAPLHVSTAASKQDYPAIARSATQYLVVWEDFRADQQQELRAARVSLDGTVLDPNGIELCEAAGDQGFPRVAAAANGDFFVVWADTRAQVTTYTDLYGTLVRADGTVVTPCGARLTTADDATLPAIASDGTGFLLAWFESSDPFINNVVKASRLSAAGVMLDSPPLNLSPTGGVANPAVAWGDGMYLIVYEGSGGLRGVRVRPTGVPLDAPPGMWLGGYGGFPSVTFDGRQWVLGFRRYFSGSNVHMYARRIATDGGVLDDGGVQLSTSTVYGYTSAYYRQAPEASFDGVDSVFTWASNYEGGEVFTAWLSPDGGVIASSRVVSEPSSIPLSATISGRGDGNHSLLSYVYGDTTPGVRAFRVGTQVVTFRINGEACSLDTECKSGWCVDGFCCNTACGSGATTDCQVCSAALGATANGVCTPAPQGRACRASDGGCDLPDTCDGVTVACADQVRPSTTQCRASTGTCDPAEFCTGASPACPTDAFASAATVCRAGAGACDVAERCTGSSASCPGDAWLDAGTTCRGASGACDVAEVCTGLSAQCPADALASATTTCRAAAGACDVAERCTGSSDTCPADGFAAATTVCRAEAGLCDVAERCTGSTAACPGDGFLGSGTACRAAAGPCDVAESCTGSGPACPGDGLRAAGASCRASAGPCDVAEQCSGTSVACPVDTLRDAGVSCRASAGVCDVAEVCSGAAAECPADGYRDAGIACRPANGACDVAEACSGAAAACPADRFAAQGTSCRASAGACDVAEVCSGTTGACPADGLRAAGTSCRAAVSACDAEERCTGATVACPADGAAPNGTSCGPATSCGSSLACQAGQCVSGPPPSCDDGDACTSDGCTEGAGCTHAAITGCCRTAADCNDGDVCTADVCRNNRCERSPIATCCRGDGDCDDGDSCTIDSCVGGTCLNSQKLQCTPSAPTGCGCGSGGGLEGFAGLALLLTWAGRSRRRRSELA